MTNLCRIEIKIDSAGSFVTRFSKKWFVTRNNILEESSNKIIESNTDVDDENGDENGDEKLPSSSVSHQHYRVINIAIAHIDRWDSVK